MPELVLDINRESSARARWDLPSRLVMLAAGLVGVLGGSAVLVQTSHRLGTSLEATAAVSFVTAVGCYLLASSTALMTRGPSSLIFTPTGIDAAFQRGRKPLVRWDDPKLRIVLKDFRDYERALHRRYASNRSGLVWVSPGLRGFDMSARAYEQILAAARTSGARVNAQASGGRGDSRPISYTEITRRDESRLSISPLPR